LSVGFYFERAFCIGCHACSVACDEEKGRVEGPSRRRVYEVLDGGFRREGAGLVPEVEASWISIACCHCEKPSCLSACPSGAISKRGSDGLVLVDEGTCSGCGSCAEACPYGAIAIVGDRARKCDLCADRLSRGAPPSCVAACPMRALGSGELAELRERLAAVSSSTDLQNIDIGLGARGGGEGLPDPELSLPSLVIRERR
jgi:anaerobic dimethyl sulfoxide reductase subunit B